MSGAFGAIAAAGLLAAYVVVPTGAAIAESEPSDQPLTAFALAQDGAQSLVVDTSGQSRETGSFARGSYEVYVEPEPEPEPVAQPVSSESTEPADAGGWAPPAVVPDPGSAQGIAQEMVAARGWGQAEFDCLVALWNKESGWRVNAHNVSSGAYGIPQSLPGNKMASAGADWQTNPATQITWGLGYIEGRYGAPCGAWGHSQSVGWY
ncbi:lytic transglycosylase domain-containing protein [Microbacterium sp. LRZ72]|nr:lytic transglycosylase domain-containing protein [Microbacterium sp. LRZ72]